MQPPVLPMPQWPNGQPLLGTGYTAPLLGPPQPQNLLDAFAPGTGFGYDVATGIAGAQGGPMTAIAAGMAHAKDKALERSILSARGRINAMPAKTQEVLNLMQMGVPQAQALRMTYPGGTQSGTELVTQGGVTYESYTTPTGTTGYRPLDRPHRTERLEVLEEESGAQARGSEQEKARVTMRRTIIDEYNKGVRAIPSQLDRYLKLLGEFESGKYQSGKFNQARRFFDAEIQELDYQSAISILDRYTGLGMGVLSDSDIELLRNSGPSSDKSREANIAILRDMTDALQSQYEYLEMLRDQLRQPGFDPLEWIQPLRSSPRIDQRRQSPSVPAGPVPEAAPTPQGFDAEFDTMMRGG